EFTRMQAQSGTTFDGKRHEADRLLKKQEKEAQLVKMMDQCNALMREHKYKDAYVWAEQANELDPDNATVQMARTMARTAMRIQEQKELGAEAEKIGYTELNYDYGHEVNLKTPVIFDKDVLDKSRTRKNF